MKYTDVMPKSLNFLASYPCMKVASETTNQTEMNLSIQNSTASILKNILTPEYFFACQIRNIDIHKVLIC